ncbi:MAG TPA: helix-turn-helix transcriptional regulator [Vicinamibacteria bacterium]|nr:helix-turn-helix transcriptional regulator [Vicinamibacteria bacterium]
MSDSPLTTVGILLLALREGPGYGLELTRRAEAMAGAPVASSSVHRALDRLRRAGHVRRWTVVPGRRRGARARAYYELTARGVARVEAITEALRPLVLRNDARSSGAEVRAMRDRLREAGDASAFVASLQRRARRGGA